jgi:hypothetical protein
MRYALVLLIALAVFLTPCTAAAPAPSAYARWKNGPPKSADFFPIAVWLQDPRNAERFKAVGINLYIGLWKGPTEAQLAALTKAGMPVICEQNAVGLANKANPVIVGWMHGDEPDNAQEVTDPKTGKKGYGPCVPPAKIVADYERIKAADPTRPVILNLGQGVANDEWHGRGSGAKLTDYLTYVKGGDVVSFDIYPVASYPKQPSENYLWLVPKGVDRLVQWSEGKRIIWTCIECTRVSNPDKKATPAQVKTEVWMALVHGSTGLIYFVHQFQPKFIEAGLLADAEMTAAVTKINAEIRELAPVLNSPTVADAATVTSSAAEVPIDILCKKHDGAIYLFAVGMRNAATTGAFHAKGAAAGAKVEVLGENRTLTLKAGAFEDAFEPYAVHLYRIR